MSEKELKVGILTKRSQQKRNIGRINYKQRIFVLTSNRLTYYEGTTRDRGKFKGSIELHSVKFIGPVEDSALNRSHCFVISYGEYFLYCIALTPGERDDWLKAIKCECTKFNYMSGEYHSSLFTGKVWMCCGMPEKNTEGCKKLNISIENIPNGNSEPDDDVYLTPIPAPSLPPRNQQQQTVVANFDFKPREKSDLRLKQGERYFIVDDSREHWWKVRAIDGREGFVPANYVKLVS